MALRFILFACILLTVTASSSCARRDRATPAAVSGIPESPGRWFLYGLNANGRQVAGGTDLFRYSASTLPAAVREQSTRYVLGGVTGVTLSAPLKDRVRITSGKVIFYGRNHETLLTTGDFSSITLSNAAMEYSKAYLQEYTAATLSFSLSQREFFDVRAVKSVAIDIVGTDESDARSVRVEGTITMQTPRDGDQRAGFSDHSAR